MAVSANAADRIKPTVAITSPARGVHLTNDTVTLKGTARDNVGVDQVNFRVENSGGISAYGPVSTTNNWTNWTASVELAPGLNTVRVRASDASTNITETTTTLNYDLYKPVTLLVSPGGKVTGATNQQRLLVTKKYTLNAVAAPGYVFSHWTNSLGETNFTKSTLSFTNPPTDLTLHAFFLPATWKGIFMPLGDASVSVTNSGYFTLARTASGVLSGKIIMQGRTYPFGGKRLTNNFPYDEASFTLARPGLAPVTVFIQLNDFDISDAGTVVSGSITNANFDANVDALSPISSTNNWRGTYTARALLRPLDNRVVPGGYSPAVVKVTGSDATVSGTLQDGTPFNGTSYVGANLGDNIISIYASLQGGSGMVIGHYFFQQLETAGTIVQQKGRSFWEKGAAPKDKFYPAGFLARYQLGGTRYVAPAANTTALGITNGIAAFTGGNLSTNSAAGFETPVKIARTGMTLLQTNGLPATALNAHLQINPVTGGVTGDFKHPTTGKVSKIVGNVVQFADSPELTVKPGIFGYFMGTNETGFFVVHTGTE